MRTLRFSSPDETDDDTIRSWDAVRSTGLQTDHDRPLTYQERERLIRRVSWELYAVSLVVVVGFLLWSFAATHGGPMADAQKAAGQTVGYRNTAPLSSSSENAIAGYSLAANPTAKESR